MFYSVVNADVCREASVFKVAFQIGGRFAAIPVAFDVGEFYVVENFNEVGEVFVARRRDIIRLRNIRFQHDYAVEQVFAHRKQRCRRKAERINAVDDGIEKKHLCDCTQHRVLFLKLHFMFSGSRQDSVCPSL